ncbi:MAG: succinate dehydrogenase, hydrophobic membrane anchor protein [Hyphomonadaceae bacterium]|jgi:succinate dehydrogenase / fumarate reductase membrane anchor subunit|nr:succinate dehydrogenase, hydrophobic membrane anchor protein [Hyphomonadaceae bacterium]
MSGPQNSMRTPLGRVRHHGASGEGTGHFIASRWTGIALAVLAPWFVFNAALSIGPSYTSVIDFLTDPVNAIGVILLVTVSFYHMALGMQEVIVDYILKPFTKITLMLLNGFGLTVLAAGAIFAVLLVNFGA